MNRKDWRTVSAEDVKGDLAAAPRDLVPMLRADLAPARGEVTSWLGRLVSECRERLAIVLPLQAHELEFLDRLNGAGEIAPETLTDDPAMQALIRNLPGLRWKALNVRKRLDGGADDHEPA